MKSQTLSGTVDTVVSHNTTFCSLVPGVQLLGTKARRHTHKRNSVRVARLQLEVLRCIPNMRHHLESDTERIPGAQERALPLRLLPPSEVATNVANVLQTSGVEPWNELAR
jgi:hypothetical protein